MYKKQLFPVCFLLIFGGCTQKAPAPETRKTPTPPPPNQIIFDDPNDAPILISDNASLGDDSGAKAKTPRFTVTVSTKLTIRPEASRNHYSIGDPNGRYTHIQCVTDDAGGRFDPANNRDVHAVFYQTNSGDETHAGDGMRISVNGNRKITIHPDPNSLTLDPVVGNNAVLANDTYAFNRAKVIQGGASWSTSSKVIALHYCMDTGCANACGDPSLQPPPQSAEKK